MLHGGKKINGQRSVGNSGLNAGFLLCRASRNLKQGPAEGKVREWRGLHLPTDAGPHVFLHLTSNGQRLDGAY